MAFHRFPWGSYVAENFLSLRSPATGLWPPFHLPTGQVEPLSVVDPQHLMGFKTWGQRCKKGNCPCCASSARSTRSSHTENGTGKRTSPAHSVAEHRNQAGMRPSCLSDRIRSGLRHYCRRRLWSDRTSGQDHLVPVEVEPGAGGPAGNCVAGNLAGLGAGSLGLELCNVVGRRLGLISFMSSSWEHSRENPSGCV